jgi:putative ABC transport system permease protein
MTSVLQDLRYSLRTVRQSPGIVAVAVFSLALGIAANTTIYSVINSLRNYKLAFEDVDRLVVVWQSRPQHGVQQQVPTHEMVAALENSRYFEEFGYFQGGPAPITLAAEGEANRVSSQPVDSKVLSLLGVKPLLGRVFEPNDLTDIIYQKEVRSIVISYSTWQRQFGGDPDVIGKTLRVDGMPRPVIGVMPQDFSIMPWVENIYLWSANDLRVIPKARWMIPIGRLKPGASIQQAQAEAAGIFRGVLERSGEEVEGWTARVQPIHEAYFGGVENAFFFLLGAVGFVLLIACTNVANLLLARGAARQKELTIRASVGAGRARLVRQLLTESLLLGLLGGVCGAVLSIWGNRLFVALVPDEFPALFKNLYIDWRVLLFTLGISVLTGLLFGLLPALQASKLNLNDALKAGGRESSVAVSRGRGRSALLIAEVTLSVVLLLGAGLMMRGFLQEQNADPGFDAKNVLTAEILLGGNKYWEKIPGDKNSVTPQCAQFFEGVLERLNALPGVESAGMISRLPQEVWNHPFTIVGKPLPEPGKEPRANVNEADAKVFEALRVPLLRGRYLNGQDVEGSPWVAVVSQTFADRHFPGEDPIGKAIQLTIHSGGAGISVPEPHTREIVGVVGDFKYPSFYNPVPAAMFVPYRQHPWEYAGGDQWLHIRKMLVIRTSVDPMSLAPQVTKAVHDVDADQAAHDIFSMEHRIENSISVVQSRFLAEIFGVFGGLAIALAMVGIYGVASYSVNQRTHEFGIRMALGAADGDVIRLVLKRVLTPTLIGVALGSAAGVGLSKLLNSMFFNLTSTEPVTFGAVIGLMVGVALLAGYLPARRAIKVDPLQALRYQ